MIARTDSRISERCEGTRSSLADGLSTDWQQFGDIGRLAVGDNLTTKPLE